ncbi:MAG TPA: BON domain-containing protein [Rhizobacter sp.]|nr:BON domain-containing protein [Rhizobacter sp.]
MSKRITYALPTVGVLLAAVALAGCDRHPGSQQGANSNDAVVARADQNGRDAQNDTRNDANRAKESISDTARDVKDSTVNAAKDAKDKVSDAVITSAVKAQLAADRNLSATKVDVDTDGGRVALRGTAPSQAAKAHATELASAVKGVVAVDNQLTIESANM